jgi:hypothetical protein
VCRLSFHATSRCRTNGTSSTSRFRRNRRLLPVLPLPLLLPMLPLLLLLLLWLRWGGRVGVKVSSSSPPRWDVRARRMISAVFCRASKMVNAQSCGMPSPVPERGRRLMVGWWCGGLP